MPQHPVLTARPQSPEREMIPRVLLWACLPWRVRRWSS